MKHLKIWDKLTRYEKICLEITLVFVISTLIYFWATTPYLFTSYQVDSTSQTVICSTGEVFTYKVNLENGKTSYTATDPNGVSFTYVPYLFDGAIVGHGQAHSEFPEALWRGVFQELTYSS